MRVSGPARRRGLAADWIRFLPPLLLTVAVISCAGVPGGVRPASAQASAASDPVIESSLKEISIASPASLVKAVTTLGESTQGYSTYGLELSYVAYKMIEILYPIYLRPEYVIYPPVASIYPDLFKQVQNGVFPKVQQSDVSFLTMIIPPLAVLYSSSREVEDASLEALDHAETLNPLSVLPPYLKGVIALRASQWGQAESAFDRTLAVDSSCYPAAIGKAQVLIHEKRYTAALATLEPVEAAVPPDALLFRLEAEASFDLGNAQAADGFIAKALAVAPQDRAALVLAARIDVAQKNYAQALDRIDQRAKLGGLDESEILLKASVQTDAGDQVGALKTLAEGARRFPHDKQLADAYGKALINAGQTAEGSRYLSQTLAQDPEGSASLELLVSDAISRHEWNRAALYATRLLELKQDERTLGWAYTIYQALGDSAKLAEVAAKLHALDPSNDRYLLDYLESLLAVGDTKQAAALVTESLATRTLPNTRSMLYYVRSRIDSSPEAELEDLRQALFENLGNEDALIAMARYWLKAGNASLARTYVEEAKALLPVGSKLPADLESLAQPEG